MDRVLTNQTFLYAQENSALTTCFFLFFFLLIDHNNECFQDEFFVCARELIVQYFF